MKKFESFIKEYATRDFIYFFSDVSTKIFKKQLLEEKENMNCCMTFLFDALLHGFIHKQVPVMLSAWDIQGMAYLSIKYSNDYRNKIMEIEQAGKAVNYYRGYENEHSKTECIKEAGIKDVFKFLMGMTYEQFKYQNLSWIFQNFNRNYHILVGSKKINREKIVDINEITNDLFGLSADELLSVEMIILWLCSQRPDPLSAPEQLYKRKGESILTRENMQRVIDYYSITYDQVRDTFLEKQIFYGKPFVVTKKKQETIVISFYLVVMLFADGLYWLIRDYYREKKWGQKFINAFGDMFEDYFAEIADIYLPKGTWHKIPTSKKKKDKSADYYVEFDETIFLFELKSGLLGIEAKQQAPDVEKIDTFYDRNILEAYEQLKRSEEVYQGKKPIIKVFLLYENATNTQIIMSSMPEIFAMDKGCYIMTIADLEILLSTYANDIKKFKDIIKALVQNENDENNYESVLNILNQYGAIGDLHFIGERDYFEKIMKRLEIEFRIDGDKSI